MTMLDLDRVQGASRHASYAADIDECVALMRGGSRTFFAASLLLPSVIRGPATALYAFCRLADDAIDQAPVGSTQAALDGLRSRLDLVYAGRPAPICADRALTGVVERYALPRPLLDALLEGFAWDAGGRRYQEIGDLHHYAARVAGTVGAMMAVLMGARGSEALSRACDLGVAMQLSNIARDVGEDAANGRIYLPLLWLDEAGIDPDEFLARPRFDERLGWVVRRVLKEADRLYRRAEAGIADLPPSCRPSIRVASRLYCEIGREVERQGCDSVARRAVVSWQRKLSLVVRTLAAPAGQSTLRSAPALAATQFLVDAVSSTPAPAVHARATAWWDLDARVGRLISLFEQLEERDEARRDHQSAGRRAVRQTGG